MTPYWEHVTQRVQTKIFVFSFLFSCYNRLNVTSNIKNSCFLIRIKDGDEESKATKIKGTVSRYCACPNFHFWKGCCEIKRCEDSRTTLSSPFASRLADFSTTLKLLRITDQWCKVPVKFRFGRNQDFFGVTFIAVGRRTKRWEAFWHRLKT